MNFCHCDIKSEGVKSVGSCQSLRNGGPTSAELPSAVPGRHRQRDQAAWELRAVTLVQSRCGCAIGNPRPDPILSSSDLCPPAPPRGNGALLYVKTDTLMFTHFLPTVDMLRNHFYFK